MQATPFILTFLGVTGDLSQTRLIPALYELFCRQELPENFHLIGYGRREFSETDFVDFITATLPDNTQAADFLQHWHYVHGSFDQVTDFAKLSEKIKSLDSADLMKHFFYLAVAPEFYVPLTQHLHTANLLSHDKSNSAVLIEKPYGTDEQSAHELTQNLDACASEKQIFRVDHFLGKQTTRDMPRLTASEEIDHIQMTVAEEIGIGNRGAYYDAVGVIRDMIQNHCLMVVSLVLNRDDRLAALRSFTIEETVTGQYTSYLTEPHVAKNSPTETFAAIKLTSTLSEWQNIPIYIRTGKQLPEKKTVIHVVAKDPSATQEILIQPAPAGHPAHSDYANVFFDALTDNHTYFISDAEIVAAWHVIDPIMAQIKDKSPQLYKDGSWGPADADDLLARDNRTWIN